MRRKAHAWVVSGRFVKNFNNDSAGHEAVAVRQPDKRLDIVFSDNNCYSVIFQLAEDGTEFFLSLPVQLGGRLIKKYDVRVHGEDRCNA